jgi:hypothetical protein
MRAMNVTEQIEMTSGQVEALLIGSIGELFDQIVLPNYGKTTSDMVTLGPSWWSQKLGAQGIVMTADAIKHRVLRLQQKTRSGAESEGTSAVPTENQRGSVRSARAVVRAHPEMAGELVRDPDVREAITKALDDQRAVAFSAGVTPETEDHIQKMRQEHAANEAALAAAPVFDMDRLTPLYELWLAAQARLRQAQKMATDDPVSSAAWVKGEQYATDVKAAVDLMLGFLAGEGGPSLDEELRALIGGEPNA